MRAHPVKKALRQKLRERLRGLSRGERRRRSRRIQQKLARRAYFREAATILFYASLPEEVDTWALMREALRQGKRVLIPKVRGRQLVPAEVKRLSTGLKRGAYGIREPQVRIQTVRPSDIDLVIVPGLAFDGKGRRLGRGKGYYDRFLKKLRGRTRVVGLAFRFQRLRRIPVGTEDVSVNEVVCD